MAWHRNEPDPLDARRRELEQQQHRVAAQVSRLTEELRRADAAAGVKRAEPPVWRADEDAISRRPPESLSARRHLARQRRRDRLVVFALMALLLVLVIVGWMVYRHVFGPATAA